MMIRESGADARDMFTVHTMFRREFGAVPSLISTVAGGDEQRTAVVADHVALLIKILEAHHGAEDECIWPLVRERGGAEVAAIVDLMEQQHAAIHAGYLRLEEALARWRESASAASREAAAAAMSELLPLLNEHLALEETRAVPQIERLLTKAEYARLAEHGAANTPQDMFLVTFGMVIYEADPEVIDRLVDEMPAGIRPHIRGSAAAAYAEYAEKIYGTTTPDRVTRSAAR
jgi:hypothetical protein